MAKAFFQENWLLISAKMSKQFIVFGRKTAISSSKLQQDQHEQAFTINVQVL